MSNSTFAAAQITEQIINRAEEIETLKKAIFDPGSETRVVIIEGDGGLGKTRLLQEAFLRATGHAQAYHSIDDSLPLATWDNTDNIIVSNPLDFADVRLHTFLHFVQALRNAFICEHHPGADFSGYDRARAYYQRKLDEQADYRTVQEAAQATEAAFFEDYQAIACQKRLVWLLDTAERFNIVGAAWLLEEGLFTSEDLSFNTQQRLLALLQEKKLPNTTILLAGRRKEAKTYFDTLKDKKPVAGNYEPIDILLKNFDREDTRAYLAELARKWSQQDPESDIAAYLEYIVKEEPERADVLWLYTDGQPVRLALYIDILVEGKKEPEALQDSFDTAQENAGWDETTSQTDKNKLAKIQFGIEDEFINLIFSSTTDELRPQILRILAQAHRGLNEHHLHFVLDALPNTDIETWEEKPGRLAEIRAVLADMRKLSFVKSMPDGRLILQDEMYRIYDEHASADEASIQDEIELRQTLYRQLLNFVEFEIKDLTNRKTQYREKDEQSLRWESPAWALSMRFGRLSEDEMEARSRLNEKLRQAFLEKLFYELRLDPDEALNDTYYDVAEEFWRANDLEADAQIQIELWHFLNDNLAHKFINLTPREDVTAQNALWDALRRTTEQEDVIRWIKRFVLTKQYPRAVDFAEQVEAYIDALPRDKRETLGWTLGHTISKGERTCWREFARISIGQNRLISISKLEEAVRDLKRLLEPGGIPERNEIDFLDHPAEIRLRRIIGVTYNNLGIGYVHQGQFRKAAEAYAQALHYFRETGFVAQRAVTLNNLSRVLSESGRGARAIRVCRDGLDLRQSLGAENPIAYSYNTLALIYNNILQPENAWAEAAKAVVYFRRLEDPRGLGLSLLQLARVLRKLAFLEYPVGESPEEFLNEAKDAALEALEIFTETPNIKTEIMRGIEAEVEIGCLYRDYMRYVKAQTANSQGKKMRWQRFRDMALEHLNKAVNLSETNNYAQLQLDGQVKQAWTHYYAGEFDRSEEVCLHILDGLADKAYVLRKNELPPSPQKVDETYAFFQLSELWTIKGRIALDRFQACAQAIKAESRGRTEAHQRTSTDQEANQSLQAAAEAFVLALCYAMLLAESSPNVENIFDQLYDYLKIFNVSEMRAFYKYQQAARETYKFEEIRNENLADIKVFLQESFGDYLPEDPGKGVKS